MLKQYGNGFRFGLEAEFLLVEAATMAPLWHKELSFELLNGIFESIPLDGIPPLEGLELEAPMRKLMPYVIEGYHLPDMDFHAVDVLPKGVEIRTPVCGSVEECLELFRVLYERLQRRLLEDGMAMVSLSHHPLETSFSGPQNKRRHDYWQWSMEVMCTYGPDVNVGLPAAMAAALDPADFEAKINFYGPALSALSVASPFCGGVPWEIRGRRGQSFRMHKRSYIAPPIEFHPDEKDRLEFKVFDMPGSTREFSAQFASFLALLLDNSLAGRASRQTRIYDLGQVARLGLRADGVRERAAELLERAPQVLARHGFAHDSLELFRERLLRVRSPADEMLELYDRTGRIEEVLRARSRFVFD